ncbi:MAG TPA: serine--tRNA ligase [Thermoplasmata archaeon]|nr:serine--tRNA ligase [Thermoplasmata archaeon]
MENSITAVITLSAAPPDPAAVGRTIAPLADDVFKRTVGQRGSARLARHELRGDQLTVEIDSDGVRPHQSLLSLARRLGEELGKTAKVGVRSIVASRYRLTFTVDPPPKAPVKLPLPHRLSFHGTRAELELDELPEEALRDNWADRAVTLVQQKARRQEYAGKEQFWQLIEQRPAQEHRFHDDPTEAMLKRHWLRSGPTKGKWFLGPRAAHLLRTMERIAVEEVLRPLGFQEVVQPHHDTFETLVKTGHLEGVPGEFYYVTEPRSRDPADWETFTDLVAITRQVPHAELAKLVSPPSAVSCYAQCPTTYWWLSGRTIATESLPLLVYDRASISNRYESGGRHGLERVDEFHRIEPVYLGTAAQLTELRTKMLEKYRRVFDSILELEWRTAWVTPFYLQQSGGVGGEADGERVTGTIDFEAYLPYRGERTKAEWLEFQNLSIVGEKYTKAFTIRAQKGDLWSGCSGIGLERWLTSFLAQKGLDPEGWPDGFRKFVGEWPADVKFL